MSSYFLISTNPYFIIFYNSMQANLPLSLRSENAWFAALNFGNHNMVLATALAFVASTISICLTFTLGYYLSRWRGELPAFNETKYQRIVSLFDRRLFMLMVIPPVSVIEFIPGISFMPLFIFICGLFRVPPKQAVGAIALSRILYYGYYLTH